MRISQLVLNGHQCAGNDFEPKLLFAFSLWFREDHSQRKGGLKILTHYYVLLSFTTKEILTLKLISLNWRRVTFKLHYPLKLHCKPIKKNIFLAFTINNLTPSSIEHKIE